MRYEVDAPTEDVHRLIEPFYIYRGVEALNVVPPCLFVSVRVVVVAKAYSNYVVCTKYLLYGPYNDIWDLCCGKVLETIVVLI